MAGRNGVVSGAAFSFFLQNKFHAPTLPRCDPGTQRSQTSGSWTQRLAFAMACPAYISGNRRRVEYITRHASLGIGSVSVFRSRRFGESDGSVEEDVRGGTRTRSQMNVG